MYESYAFLRMEVSDRSSICTKIVELEFITLQTQNKGLVRQRIELGKSTDIFLLYSSCEVLRIDFYRVEKSCCDISRDLDIVFCKIIHNDRGTRTDDPVILKCIFIIGYPRVMIDTCDFVTDKIRKIRIILLTIDIDHIIFFAAFIVNCIDRLDMELFRHQF